MRRAVKKKPSENNFQMQTLNGFTPNGYQRKALQHT